MKIKEGYRMRDAAGSHIVVAVGNAADTFSGMIRLNETGAFLFRLLDRETDADQLAAALCGAYDVDASSARRDVDAFLAVLRETGAIAG